MTQYQTNSKDSRAIVIPENRGNQTVPDLLTSSPLVPFRTNSRSVTITGGRSASNVEPAIKMKLTQTLCGLAGSFLLLFAGLSLSGCQPAHMALPQDLQGESSELAVEGRFALIIKKSFQIGPYNVNNVHRGWTKGGGFSIAGYRSSEAKQEYEFSINEPDRTKWAVQCATVADWSQLEMEGFLGGKLTAELTSKQQLVCTMTKNGGKKPSKLVMTQSADDTALNGVMTDGATQIDLSATHKLAETSFQVGEPTGYVFHIKGSPVGAVEVINQGTVWLNNSVTPEIRSALVVTSAVLLLYQDVKKM